MMLDEFLTDYLDDEAFGAANLTFWVRAVMKAMFCLGLETDANLERFSGLLLDYYNGADVERTTIEGIRKEMMHLGMDTSWKNQTSLGDKYRVLWAMADSRENSAADRENFRYGVSTAFSTINRDEDHDQCLIDMICECARKEGADLFEPPAPRPRGGRLV